MDIFEQQADKMVEEMLNQKPLTEHSFKHELISVLDDGRVQVKITCDNEWLKKPVYVITNNEQIGITPFHKGHVVRLTTHDEQGNLSVLFGYFDETSFETDENLYIDGICKTLISGPTEDFFGTYGESITAN